MASGDLKSNNSDLQPTMYKGFLVIVEKLQCHNTYDDVPIVTRCVVLMTATHLTVAKREEGTAVLQTGTTLAPYDLSGGTKCATSVNMSG